MPLLPSGRNIAIGTNSLCRLLETAANGFRVHELMSIDEPTHLLPYLDIYYFRPAAPDDNAIEYTDAALTPPHGLVPISSGHKLATIHTEWEQWLAEDRQGFVNYLDEPRFSDYLNSLFKYIEIYKLTLRYSGTFAARVQVHWWNGCIHLLQIEKIDD